MTPSTVNIYENTYYIESVIGHSKGDDHNGHMDIKTGKDRHRKGARKMNSKIKKVTTKSVL